MTESKYPLWEARKELPRASFSRGAFMMIATVVLAVLTADGFGGMFCIGIAAAFFAALLCTVRSPIVWLALPLSFGGAYLLSKDLLLSLGVLLFVPLGLLLAYTLFFEKSFSVSVTGLTVALLFSMGFLLLVSVTELYEGTVREAVSAFLGDIELSFREAFASFTYPTAEGEVYSLPADAVDRLIEITVMIMPAVAVVTCQLLAYITAKIFRLIIRKNGFGFMFGKRTGAVTVSGAASVVYLVAVAVSFFSAEASVIAYSAINISYILMPAMAIVGFNTLLGKNGFFGKRFSGTSHIIMIVAVMFMIFMSPVGFLQMLAVFAAIHTVGKAFISRRDKKHGNEDGGE